MLLESWKNEMCQSELRHLRLGEGQYKQWSLTLSKQNFIGTLETTSPQGTINSNSVLLNNTITVSLTVGICFVFLELKKNKKKPAMFN